MFFKTIAIFRVWQSCIFHFSRRREISRARNLHQISQVLVLLAWSNPNQSNRRLAVQWYFPLWWVFCHRIANSCIDCRDIILMLNAYARVPYKMCPSYFMFYLKIWWTNFHLLKIRWFMVVTLILSHIETHSHLPVTQCDHIWWIVTTLLRCC